MQKSRFFAIFACFSRYRKCSNLRVAEKNFEVIVVFLKIYILMVRKPPSFALWDFFLPFSLYFPRFTWLKRLSVQRIRLWNLNISSSFRNKEEFISMKWKRKRKRRRKIRLEGMKRGWVGVKKSRWNEKG